MTSEWLKVMLEEVARKRDERERAEIEQSERERERTVRASAPPQRRKQP